MRGRMTTSSQSGPVTTGFVPHALQLECIRSLRRFSVLVCHRRFGKTVLAVNLLIDGAIRCQLERPRLAYIAPLYKQAKTVAWDYLKSYAGGIPGVRFSESELRCDLPGGGRINLYGADNPDSLRGIYLDGVVFDEVAQMPERVWGEIIRPTLSDRKGWALFIGTPHGKNALYELWERAQSNPEWFAAMYRASETGLLDRDELMAAEREMDPDRYEQEFECSFSAAIRGAYYSHIISDLVKQGKIGDLPYDPSLPVVTSWDLGVSDSTSIWFIQPTRGGLLRVIDYYEANGEGLEHYAGVLRNRGYNYSQHIGPHDLRVRELGSGKSRLEIAAGLGIRFEVAPSLSVQDGINATRAALKMCAFDRDRTSAGREALAHYRRDYNDVMRDYKDKPVHDWTSHAADAFRYFAVGYRPAGDSLTARARRNAPRQRYSICSI